jgi:hypothetical protein
MIDEFRDRWDEDQEEEARERRERKLEWEQELLRLYELGDSYEYHTGNKT